jgi:hypothetical protein
MKNKLKQIIKSNSQSNTILIDEIFLKKSIKKEREMIQLGQPATRVMRRG